MRFQQSQANFLRLLPLFCRRKEPKNLLYKETQILPEISSVIFAHSICWKKFVSFSPDPSFISSSTFFFSSFSLVLQLQFDCSFFLRSGSLSLFPFSFSLFNIRVSLFLRHLFVGFLDRSFSDSIPLFDPSYSSRSFSSVLYLFCMPIRFFDLSTIPVPCCKRSHVENSVFA